MSESYIYILKNPLFKGYKIGFSKDVDKRIASLNTACPKDFELIKKFPVNGGLFFEKIVHRELDGFKMEREFFDIPKDRIVEMVIEAISKAESERVDAIGTLKLEIKNLSDVSFLIKKQRKMIKATQRDIEDVCDISHNGLSQIEIGKSEPKISTLIKLGRILGFKLVAHFDE
jgi:DNA-binding XRE family transcriptional regulator